MALITRTNGDGFSRGLQGETPCSDMVTYPQMTRSAIRCCTGTIFFMNALHETIRRLAPSSPQLPEVSGCAGLGPITLDISVCSAAPTFPTVGDSGEVNENTCIK